MCIENYWVYPDDYFPTGNVLQPWRITHWHLGCLSEDTLAQAGKVAFWEQGLQRSSARLLDEHCWPISTFFSIQCSQDGTTLKAFCYERMPQALHADGGLLLFILSAKEIQIELFQKYVQN